MKNLIFALLISIPAISWAEYTGGRKPSLIQASDTVQFAIDYQPTSTTCSYENRHLKFDATTKAGKNMLSILLAANLSDRKIDIWYSASSAPGTDENSGCNETTMAVLTSVGFN